MPAADDIRHYEARLAREPSSLAYAALAEAYRRAGRLDDAIATSEEGLRRYPAYATTRWVLAKACRDREDIPRARAEVMRFLEVEPDHEPALRLALECALRLADPVTAVNCLRRLHALDPHDRTVLGQLRALETALGGERLAREAGGLWPLLLDETFVTVSFGELCLAQGLWDEALAVFGRLVVRNPDHPVARARLAEIGRARAEARRPRG